MPCNCPGGELEGAKMRREQNNSLARLGQILEKLKA
jgi:hypothetical protein